ncbi:MAG: methionyl-tRNA formyltransferase [Thermodesulfobacteriota bacterium]
MKIVFMGTPDFAIPALDLLIESGENIVGALTMPDRPKGRGRKLKAPPVKETAERHCITVFQPEKIIDDPFISKLKELNPDVIVVVAFGQILSKEILKIPRFGCVNLHASLLPRYRGAAPINWAVINGEKVTGVTTMLMDEGLDTGDILLQQEVGVEEEDTAENLHDKLAKTGAKLLLETLHRLKEGSITPVPQNHSKATIAPMLKKGDGLIDWGKEAVRISNLIKGLTPWPGAFTHLQDKILKIFKGIALGEDSEDNTPGTITEMNEKGIKVSTGKGVLLITEVQLQGHKKMGIADFLRGHKYKISMGTTLR